jgi:Ca-activated chloride channel family protein
MFELANPWALVALIIPVLVWFLVPKAPTFFSAALKVPFFQSMLALVENPKNALASQAVLLIPGLVWILLVLALAGPRWIGEPRPLVREGYNIMMALDLSASMEITDMIFKGQAVSRLGVVKGAAKQFVKERTGDKIGLILFGSRAYLQTPLTFDRNNVLQRLDDASAGLAGKTTSIGDALGLAVKRLMDVPKQGRIIILLTDGANNSGVLAPLKAAELAKDEGIKVYTIGLGSDASKGSLGDFFAMNVSADLDEDTLEEIAKRTGGRYFRATDTQSLHSIYKTIHELETVKQEQASIRPQKEYYPWCVGLALLIWVVWLGLKANLKCPWPARTTKELAS